MAKPIIWSRRASDDLAEIAEFIARDSEGYSASVIRTIIRKTNILSDFPFVGRIVPEFDNNFIREVFAYSYRIVYRVQENAVWIAAVVHSKRILDISLKP